MLHNDLFEPEYIKQTRGTGVIVPEKDWLNIFQATDCSESQTIIKSGSECVVGPLRGFKFTFQINAGSFFFLVAKAVMLNKVRVLQKVKSERFILS